MSSHSRSHLIICSTLFFTSIALKKLTNGLQGISFCYPNKKNMKAKYGNKLFG